MARPGPVIQPLEIVAMKKSLLALAVLGAFSGVASAQSSVTLFGILDVGYNYLKNDGGVKQHRLANDQTTTSRFGVRGVEDLGGGLKAGFWLESQVSPDNGSSQGAFWARRATASLLGGFGEVRLGRDFVPTYTSWADYAVFSTNGSAGSNLFNNNTLTVSGSASPVTGGANTATRADNLVSYFLPSGLGGLIGQFSAAAGENVLGNKYYGGRIGYAAGPISAQVGYSTTESATIAGDDDYVRWTVAGSYDAGVVKVLAYYIKGEQGPRESESYELGVSAPIGSGLIRASYAHIELSGAGVLNGDADRLALGYIHNLSKRTALYATISQIDNDTGNTFSVAANGGSASNNTTPPTVGSGTKSKGLDLGVRHSF
jgi:predicted porin